MTDKSQTTEERASPGEISRGRTAVNALKLLAETARSFGYQNRVGESNQEMIGRTLRDLAHADLGKKVVMNETPKQTTETRCAGANIPGSYLDTCPRCGATSEDVCGDTTARKTQEKAYQARARKFMESESVR